MIRLVLLLLAGGAIAIGAAWLADHDGIFLLTMDGYEIRTSAAFAMFLLILAAACLLLVLWFLSMAVRSPGQVGSFFSARRGRQAYQTLTAGLIAAAAGDTEEAATLARRSGKLMGAEPLALLLKAQALQLAGQEEKQEAVYRTMLDSPETEYLGLRGLALLAMRRHDEEQVLALLVRAQALKPKGAWGLNALFDLRTARREWQEAAALLAVAARARLVTPDIAKRRRGVLLTAQAEDEDRAGAPDAALLHALEALTLAPGLTVAALIATAPLAKQGRAWKAQDIIEAAWVQAPHPDLAQAYAAIHSDDDREARARRLAGLAQLNPMHRESRILAAEQGIARKRWVEARAMLELLVRELPSQRLCALMAEIAQGEGDMASAQSWRARAARAPEDAQWLCGLCGRDGPSWSALCPHCGNFDSLRWTVRGQSAIETAPERSRVTSPGIVPLAAGTGADGPAVEAAPHAAIPARGFPAAENATPFFRPPDDPGLFDDDDETAIPGEQHPG